jgi:hypothetical protein
LPLISINGRHDLLGFVKRLTDECCPLVTTKVSSLIDVDVTKKFNKMLKCGRNIYGPF